MAGTPTTTTSSPSTSKPTGSDKESPRLSIGQKKTQAGLSTSIDDYDNYDDTDYEAIAKEIREEEDRDDNSKPLRFQETVPSSRHSSESRNPEDLQAATPATKLPLPQGEGWGEGTAGILNKPLPPRRGKARACPELAEGMGERAPHKARSRTRQPPSVNKVKPSSKSSRKPWTAATSGPPSAQRQNTAA